MYIETNILKRVSTTTKKCLCFDNVCDPQAKYFESTKKKKKKKKRAM